MARYLEIRDALKSVSHPLPQPGPGDWLAEHEETGQTFREYVAAAPLRPDPPRNVIYVTAIGTFSEAEVRVVEATIEALGLYYDRPVKVREPLMDSAIPAKARRTHPEWGMEQFLTGHILYEVLEPNLPTDAAVSLALTATDLWPGDGWNFVFGQASYRKRVGVFSTARLGDPAESPEAFRLALRRLTQTATHETGHMFSMKHCTAHLCNMNGVNHREEADSRPMTMCAECGTKLLWATETDALKRYTALEAFARKHGLTADAEEFARAREAVRPVAT